MLKILKINKVLRLNNINNMNNCPTIKEISIPGCYTGVLKVNTGLEPGTVLIWKVGREGGIYTKFAYATVDEAGDITINPELSHFNTYVLRFKDIKLNPLTIKGYDCYRLLPEKNTNEVIDVVI